MPDYRPAIKMLRISCTPNQPQYGFSHQLFGSGANQFSQFSNFQTSSSFPFSHICPDPQLTGPYARFCIPNRPGICYCYNQRVRFLQPLSMTCKAMRLRLLPWVWECLELPPVFRRTAGERVAKRLDSVVNAVHADMFLAASVKYVPPVSFFVPRSGLISVL